MTSECSHLRELLSAHLDGELSPADARRIEEHLATCAACRAILASYREADAAFAGEEVALSDPTWEKLARRIDGAVAREAHPVSDPRDRENADRPGAKGAARRWRSLLSGISARRLGLGTAGGLAIAALIILLFPWREEVPISRGTGEPTRLPETASKTPTAKKGGGRSLTVEPPSGPGPLGSVREREKTGLERDEEGADDVRLERLRLRAREAVSGGGIAEALAAAQALDGFLTEFPASDRRLEILELSARVWVRLAEIDPARHCETARARIREWEAAAGDNPFPELRALRQRLLRGPCAP